MTGKSGKMAKADFYTPDPSEDDLRAGRELDVGKVYPAVNEGLGIGKPEGIIGNSAADLEHMRGLFSAVADARYMEDKAARDENLERHWEMNPVTTPIRNPDNHYLETEYGRMMINVSLTLDELHDATGMFRQPKIH